MPDTTRHAVYAVLSTGAKVKVTPDLPWNLAVDTYEGILGDLDCADRVCIDRDAFVTVGDYIGNVRWFSVRSTDDPGWPSGQPPHSLTLHERASQ